MSLEPSSKLGPYEIVAKIGAGGMGEVYRAIGQRFVATFSNFTTMKRNLFAGLFLLVLLFVAGCAKHYTGVVVSVTDGDTLTVQKGSAHKKIRLFGIDCPEGTQAFGDEAGDFTSRLALQQTVRVEPVEKDAYGRIVAKIYLPDGRYLNAEIVAAGYAWWFRKYAPNDKLFERLEREARAEHRGLWGANKQPVAPWNFRR